MMIKHFCTSPNYGTENLTPGTMVPLRPILPLHAHKGSPSARFPMLHGRYKVCGGRRLALVGLPAIRTTSPVPHGLTLTDLPTGERFLRSRKIHMRNPTTSRVLRASATRPYREGLLVLKANHCRCQLMTV